MFHLQTALCLKINENNYWQEYDLSQTSVQSLFLYFISVIVKVTRDDSTTPLYVNIEQFRNNHNGYQGSIESLLNNLGDESFDTVSGFPNQTSKKVLYTDAIQANYKINPVNIGDPDSRNLPMSSLRDLEIYRNRPQTFSKDLHDYCLLSVNGLFHLTDSKLDGSVAYIKNGFTTAKLKNFATIGICSFKNIGQIQKVPITANMIHVDQNTHLKDRTFFRLNNLNINDTNKTVLLVIGGYLIFPEDNVFWKMNNLLYAFNPLGLPLLERYYESKNSLDLSSLNLPVSESNPTLINVNDFYSNETLTRYFTLSQSFFVIVNKPTLYCEKIEIRNSRILGSFTTYQEPVYPLFGNYGKLIDYWKTSNYGHWEIKSVDSQLNNYVFSYSKTTQLEVISEAGIPNFRTEPTNAFLFYIYST